MYCKYFGLHSHPFKITPDTRKFFSGACRGAILDALKYSILSGEGIVKMVGEVGSGKTMLCRTLIHTLPLSVEIAYLANPSLSRIEVLRAISQELGLVNVSNTSDRLDLLNNLQHHLIRLHGKGCRVVIIVEEAQGMRLRPWRNYVFCPILKPVMKSSSRSCSSASRNWTRGWPSLEFAS